ncbi:hypothetical protein CRYUN_Cryun11dG0058800 [Craigia yunnanensis]
MFHISSRPGNGERREGIGRLVAVAVDTDSKSSQRALKWTVENFITRGQTLRLVHVIQRPPSNPNPVGIDDSSVAERQLDNQTMDLFLPFRCFCTKRKYIYEFRLTYRLFKATDIHASILKWTPDFCNVYVISKGKVPAVRSATRPVPIVRGDAISCRPKNLNNEALSVISLSRENGGLFYDEVAAIENYMISSSGASTDSSFISFYKNLGSTNDQNLHSLDPYRRSSAGGTITTLDTFNSATKYPSDLTTLPDFASIYRMLEQQLLQNLQ